jgi:error-prone DNA polymerase
MTEYGAPPAYAELHCLSNFSFLRGASHPEELVARAHQLGYSALAITDECSFAGVVRAHGAAKECGLPLILGSEIRLADGPQLVLLATEREGYGNLSELITRGRRRGVKGRYVLEAKDLDQGLPSCLALLVPGAALDLAQARWLAERFPARAWIAVELLCGPDDRARLAALRELGKASGLPLVAAGDVHMHLRSRRKLQDTLTAIRLCKPVAHCGHALYPNAERHLRLRLRLANLYPREMLEETVHIAARCKFSLDCLRYEYPEEIVPPGATPSGHLRALTEAGLARRFPEGVPHKVHALVEHELELIAELGYEPYFLTVHDIVSFARSRNILCQGRGSAANSAVCYALGVTEVDPARMSMLFERFVSRERNEPPDIDVDFEHQRREEVIQYIYAKYGRERAALAATVIRYRPKSALRDCGKALGLELGQVEQLAKSLSWWDKRQALPERLRETGFDPANPTVQRLLALVDALLGFPRHLSQHVGGFVISRGLLSRLVPIENAAMPDRSVIQWDKDDLDALGLLKVDVLALGMLSAIKRALDLIGQQKGAALAMSDVPAEDPEVYAMIQQADTVGVFQIESRAQMSMLPRLRPENFYDLVIEIAIVRPGPIRAAWCIPICAAARAESWAIRATRSLCSSAPQEYRFPEEGDAAAVVAAGFLRGGADPCTADGSVEKKGGLSLRAAPDQGMLARAMRVGSPNAFISRVGFGRRFPESHSRASPCSSGIAWPSAALRVPRRAAQQPTDGFLCAIATGAARAPPRRRGAAGGRARERLGMHAGNRRERCARGAPRLAHGERPVRGRRRAHRVGARRRICFGRRIDASRASRSARTQVPRGEQRAHRHRRPPATRLLAGRRRGHRVAPASGGSDP